MEAVYRSTWRTQVTKLCKEASDYLKVFKAIKVTDVSDPETDKGDISVLLERIKSAQSNLKKADEALWKITTPDEKECERALEYDDKAVTIIAQLEFVLRNNFQQAHCSNELFNDGTIHNISQAEKSDYCGVKLRAIELKKFDGKFENWLPFWEQFKRAVHDNPKLSATAKFHFLSEALVGKAAATISGFTPTGRCYTEAISLLQDEFGKTEKIVEKFIQKLINLKPVHSTSDIIGLRQLFNEVTTTMRSLTALQVASSQYEIVVKSVLLKSIPANMRIRYHRTQTGFKGSLSSTLLNTGAVAVSDKHIAPEEEQLKSLLDFIKVEVEALEKSHLAERERTPEERLRREGRSITDTATGLISTHSEKQQCVLCKRIGHATKDCKSNLTVDQKKALLRREGRCFRCANKNHASKFCKAHWIKCENCSGRHLTSMCEQANRGAQDNGEVVEKVNKTCEKNTGGTTGDFASFSAEEEREPEIYLQTAKAILSNKQNSECILSRIIMDNGSQRTYVSEKVAKALNLTTSGKKKMRIIGFGERGNKRSSDFDCVEVSLKIQYSATIIIVTAVVVPTICADFIPVPKLNSEGLRHIKLQLADSKNCNEKLISGINLLIGQDYYWQFNTNESEMISANLAAVRTFFGWTLQGRYDQGEDLSGALNVSSVDEKRFDISAFWNLESVGITNCQSSEEKLTIESVILGIKKNSERYEVHLPWRSTSETLNDNKRIALQRLRSLTTKLMKNSNSMADYDKGIRELIRSGIAEEVTGETSGKYVYYMPHMPVYREDKVTTRMRIVFDASSSEPGFSSLNDHLSVGDNLIADLLSMLVRFRSNKIAVVSDIEKAFLQISIADGDRDSHRFLWYKSVPNLIEELPKLAVYRMTRVTFGIASSPFLLAATIRKHLELSEPQYGPVCDRLKKSFYVDDLITSERTFEDAVNIYQRSNEIMRAANFHLRKWNSNHAALRKYFTSGETAATLSQKVLGINWCTASDEISVDIKNVVDFVQSLRGTKRNVMKAMAKIYDPLGILGPYTVRIKLLLQEIWKSNLDWDQTLSGDILSDFQCWQEELPTLCDFTLKRCLSVSSEYNSELHIFADASPKAYGAVAYVRQVLSDGAVLINLICSKNRVSPIGKTTSNSELTLPKLELTAALIAARLKEFLIKSLDFDINSVNLWTDSTIALNWISGQGKQIKSYVKARVNEISRLTNITIGGIVIVKSDLWRYGPAWLAEDRNFAAAPTIKYSTNLFAGETEGISEQRETLEPILVIENFSHMKKLLRISAFVFRFIAVLKGRSNQRQRKIKSAAEIEELTYLELREAESYWVNYTQRCCYQKEIEALTRNQKFPSDSRIISLNPVLEDGILRLSGRLPKSAFGKFCNPIILPKHSHFSRLLIIEAHQSTLHGGVSLVLSHIRKKYWIVQGRQLIRNILKQCVICKRLHGKAASEPWTVLPAERVVTSRPFETTGVDFLGPLFVIAENTIGKRKVYIMLFTCAAIRAIHLELVGDLTVKSCIDALRRFIARRGVPTTIISDNAKTFKRADLELRKLEELMKKSEVQQLAAHQGISWKYIPERAAWWGGFWERLVRSVKNALKAAIGKSCVTYDDLVTLLTEVEGVTNSRPLTYITDDHKDLELLSPANFLTENNSILIPADFNSDGSTISKSWQLRQVLMKRYLKRWREEYLNQLRSIHHNTSGPSRGVKIGDVVLVHEDNKPRLLWRLAVVQHVYPGRDGRVRACDIRLKNQQVLRRPIQLLFPLEISSRIAGPEDVEN